MTPTRLAPIIALVLGLTACGGENQNAAPDPSLVDAIEDEFPDPDTTLPPATVPATTSTTSPGEPWAGDAEAAIAAIEDHLAVVHSGATYTPNIIEVLIDPAAGTATIATTLPAAAVDTPTYALAACSDAAMVAFIAPASLRRLEVAAIDGSIIVGISQGGECA